MTKRTISDWLRHAEASNDVAEILRFVDEANAQAASCFDLRSLLAGMLALASVPDERCASLADRALDAAIREREVWGFRDVAEARLRRLDDREGARAALDAGSSVFQSPRTDAVGVTAAVLGASAFARGYEWVLLGAGYRETLGDANGARRCLELGESHARAASNAADLCAIAVEWAKHCDRTRGMEKLLEAEGLAEKNGSAQP